jgi:cytochrome c oxidase subunit IV
MSHGAATQALEPADHSHAHPSERKYIQIAIILTVITLVEVVIYYIDWMHDTGALVPVLFILSIAKFATVVGYYMHLKFDDRRFLMIFLGGLLIALAVIGALYVLETTHRIDYSFGML